MRATISFDEDSRLVNQLIELLTREQKSLVANKIDEIERLIDLKASLLQQINLVAKNRYAALQARNFEGNENGMVNWVVAESNQTITEKWQQFQQALVKAKELNRLNGDLISKHFNRNKQTLHNLQTSFQSNDTYSSTGQSQLHAYKKSTLTA